MYNLILNKRVHLLPTNLHAVLTGKLGPSSGILSFRVKTCKKKRFAEKRRTPSKRKPSRMSVNLVLPWQPQHCLSLLLHALHWSRRGPERSHTSFKIILSAPFVYGVTKVDLLLEELELFPPEPPGAWLVSELAKKKKKKKKWNVSKVVGIYKTAYHKLRLAGRMYSLWSILSHDFKEFPLHTRTTTIPTTCQPTSRFYDWACTCLKIALLRARQSSRKNILVSVCCLLTEQARTLNRRQGWEPCALCHAGNPKFNGSYFGLPLSSIHRMTGWVAILCELDACPQALSTQSRLGRKENEFLISVVSNVLKRWPWQQANPVNCFLWRIFLDKWLEAHCREKKKTLEKSGLEPYGTNTPNQSEALRFIYSA